MGAAEGPNGLWLPYIMKHKVLSKIVYNLIFLKFMILKSNEKINIFVYIIIYKLKVL